MAEQLPPKSPSQLQQNLRPNWGANPVLKKVFFLTAITVIIVAVLMGSYVLLKPIRAKQIAQEALDLLRDGKSSAASQKSIVAIQMAPRDVEVARAFAKVWTAISPSEAVPLWEKVIELRGSLAEDRQNLALALINAGETERAKKETDKLLEEFPNDPQTTFVQANWLLSAMQGKESLKKIVQLVDAHPSDERYWKFYSIIAPSQGEQSLAQYIKRLEAAKKNKSRLGLWALAELARYCPTKELEGRLAELMRHPQATRRTFLLAYQLRHVRASMPFDQIEKEVERQFNKASATDRLELAEFYRDIGYHEGVLSLIPPNIAIKSRTELMLYLDALSGVGRWNAVLEVLSMDKLPLEDHWHEVFRARAYEALGQKDASVLAWRKALSEARDDSKSLSDIAYYVIGMNIRSRVDEVMSRLVEISGPMERPLHYRLWVQDALSNRNTVRLQVILQKMLTEYPNNLSAKNDYLYYTLLLGKKSDGTAIDIKSIASEAYQLAQKSPSVLSYRMTLALALLKSGDVTRSYEVISATRIEDWALLPGGYQCLRAAVYKRAGKSSIQISPAVLKAVLPEEKSLLEP
jgi:tetratricopeptide (TPR) repeat protein